MYIYIADSRQAHAIESKVSYVMTHMIDYICTNIREHNFTSLFIFNTYEHGINLIKTMEIDI